VTFRARLILAAAGAVAVAVALASLLVYVLVRNELRGQVDERLVERAEATRRLPVLEICLSGQGNRLIEERRPRFGGPRGYVQVVCPGELEIVREPGEPVALPVSDDARAVALGQREAFFADATVQETHVRVLTVPAAAGIAVQVARPLDEVDDALGRLRLVLVLLTVGGIGLAAALGTAVARTALAPVRRLSEATMHVTETGDLTRRVDATGADELSRLAASFNTMLGALDESLRAQRQLVTDASHELRTPLTSLRTNVEVLARADALPEDERQRLLSDVVEQISELTTLIGDLVELARGDEIHAEPDDVRLDALVEDAVERARRHAPSVVFRATVEPTVVHGFAAKLDRAVANLLDNAAKWSPPGGVVEVTVRDGEVAVRDHGPGIAPEDRARVFDRFYRAATARGTPGSGLGLAIVRQVAELHGGSASAEEAPGGGALLRLRVARATPP
jgi:two-component system, OmpR family, sensor histidine kinase MprB